MGKLLAAVFGVIPLGLAALLLGFIFPATCLVLLVAAQLPYGGDAVRAWVMGTPQPEYAGHPELYGTPAPIAPRPGWGGGTGGECEAVTVEPAGDGVFGNPLASVYVSGYVYGPTHLGVDLGLTVGTPVLAADAGTVTRVGWSSVGYGLVVDVDHGNGYRTRYAHNSELRVVCGQRVAQGELIALGGSTGNSTGPHLHFELFDPNAGGRVDPLAYLPG